MKKTLKKIGKFSLYTLLIGLISLLLFEVIYRYYFIDFYKTELKALNPNELTQEKSKTLLIFGDSFTADQNSYVSILRDSLSKTNVINSAVPGTSFLQHKLFFNDRVNAFKPEHIIIQIYVGNDLIDYDHPTNWSELSFIRNFYWAVSDNLISLQYLNYRMGQFFRPVPKNFSDPKLDDKFNPNTYNHREKLYYKASPLSLNNAILGKGKELMILNELYEDLHSILTENTIPTTILIIPHAAQTNNKKFNHLKEIGAQFDGNIKSFKKFAFYHFLNEKLSELKHVQVLSPVKEFQLDTNKLYYNNDPHLNKIGQAKLAEFLLKSITI